MRDRLMTRAERALQNIATALKVPLSRFVPGNRLLPGKQDRGPRMTRGIALGVNSPGDGSTRYNIEYYSGEGTGCRDAGHFLGIGALEGFLRSIRDAESIKRFNREDRKRKL